MLVVLVHGWGVRTPDYGSLPSLLGAEILEIRLSEYISYSDEVTMTDLANAFERARLASFPLREFACITHSTGGPVMRTWLDRYNGPMTALVMLAPPNHGSALARLGKGRLSRIRSWIQGVEPGQRILDWLEPGSVESWDLNVRWLDSAWPGRMLVLCGATPDRSLYDHLNSYTGERGSDGVVRLASANMNYSFMRLRQLGAKLELARSSRSPGVPFAILPSASHGSILDLDVNLATTPAASMMIFKVLDSTGQPVPDYDLLLTAGPDYSPDALPQGFFIDRQRNGNTLAYFVDHAAVSASAQLGWIIHPRPDTGPVCHTAAEFRSAMFLRAHETAMVEIVLERRIEPRVFSIRAGE